jgi:hypothetical protein
MTVMIRSSFSRVPFLPVRNSLILLWVAERKVDCSQRKFFACLTALEMAAERAASPPYYSRPPPFAPTGSCA